MVFWIIAEAKQFWDKISKTVVIFILILQEKNI